MIDLLKMATIDLAVFLETNLPNLSSNWWQNHVVDRLSFQQQRFVNEHCHTSLEQLDFAALLRVLDQNWYELSNNLSLPREARSWVKELQTVRNKWAHLSSTTIAPSEIYRDADTLGRLLTILGTAQKSLDAIEKEKAAVLEKMSPAHEPSQGKSDHRHSSSKNLSQKHNSETKQHLFLVGDVVALRSDSSKLLPVLEVIIGGTEYRYKVFEDNTQSTYYESQLQSAEISDDKRDALSISELHAHLTSVKILSPSTANLFSLRSGRVHFVPYQYRPVLKLIRADRPRLLVADEVGVGKTIEAGLIIKELRARMDVSSVLVICPKALVAERKWFTEMKRFDENFTALDGPLLRHCLRETHLDGEWPEQYSKAILPFSLFDSNLVIGNNNRKKQKDQGLLALDPPPKFDLVIVDEAHHIRNPETFLHQGIRYFCDNADAVILLTATPVQLGSKDLFTLLNVLRPDLIIDHASFEQMSEPNRYINEAVHHCRQSKPEWQKESLQSLNQAIQTEWGRLFIRESPDFQKIYDRLQDKALNDTQRVDLVHSIEDLYTFSSLINRTRRRDIGEFTTRKPETVTIDFTSDQKQLHNDLLQVIAKILIHCHGQQNVKFMMTTIRRQAASCLYGLVPLLSDMLTGKLDALEAMEANDNDADISLNFVDQVRTDIAALLEQAQNLDPYDPKIEAFVKILIEKNSLPNNKAMVFSTFRHTLAYLVQHAERAGVRYGLVHGAIPDDERADLRRRFALPKDNANAIDILLSSEVGCEGLDFQFCDFMINYDLPWNPMRIEQRIGRIDRYGQKSETVAIVNFITPGTVDADIYERCLWRIGVFQHAVGGSEEILGTITQELHSIADSFNLTDEERILQLQQLADNGIRQVREELELESKQSELFGLNVPNQSWRDEIKDAESFWLSPAAIQRSVVTYLEERTERDRENLLSSKKLKTLRLDNNARNLLLKDYKDLPRSIEPVSREWEKWLKSSESRLSITFDQETAAENPKTVYLSVLHPLVRQAAIFLNIKEPKYCVLTVQSDDAPSGTHNFAIYRWSKHGIKTDETMVAVSGNLQIESELFDLLKEAKDTDQIPLPEMAECDALDVRHYSKWSKAQANHMAANHQLIEHRVQSLTTSHRARVKTIEDQIRKSTNDKIQLMRKSELARANADFERRMAELGQAANSGDIRTAPIIFGKVIVSGEVRT
ncbi:helicase-related protein [Paremcibacter congregatus]|mgnify:CR=1 FL=1|uniref:helicase-related protein n=1 Tax=Paremcibacter congregatus TaxID=2043170 RepID=UPI0030ED0845|tara:strand:- start:5733 stop:9311 length:3579 start_codon:yes stop_codon:yes gene_type:complete